MSKQASLDIAPEMVEVTSPRHVADIWYGLGATSTAEAARELAEKHKVAGMVLMAELLEARASQIASHFKLQNIRLAAKHGMDVTTGSLMMKTEGGKIWLYMLPLAGESS